MTAPKKKPYVIKERKTIIVPVKLKQAEIAERARVLGQTLHRQRSHESELTAAKTDFKAKIDQCRDTIDKIAEVLRTGKDQREVRVEVRLDFKADKKRVVRVDTGEIISESKLPPEDRQTEIVQTKKKNSKPKGGDAARVVKAASKKAKASGAGVTKRANA